MTTTTRRRLGNVEATGAQKQNIAHPAHLERLQHVGIVHRILLDDAIDALERLDDRDAVRVVEHRQALVARDRAVGQHTDDERAQRRALGNHIQMTLMQQVGRDRNVNQRWR